MKALIAAAAAPLKHRPFESPRSPVASPVTDSVANAPGATLAITEITWKDITA